MCRLSAENAERTDIAADDKPGLFIGRNGQARCAPFDSPTQQSYNVEAGRQLSALQVCEIELAHKSASRVHACIAYDESQQPFLVDLGSTHGKTSDPCCSAKVNFSTCNPCKTSLLSRY